MGPAIFRMASRVGAASGTMTQGAGRVVWFGIAAAVIAAALLGVPGSLLATLAPGQDVPATAAANEHERLASIRERIERRRALEHGLRQRKAGLEAEVAMLVEEGEQRRDALATAGHEVQQLERELDRLVPRLLARSHEIVARRRQAARALADLAGISRQVEIEPTIRARLLAISPLMLERLHQADASLAPLREQAGRLTERQRELRERVPQLTAARPHLDMLRRQTLRRRDAAEERRRTVAAELAALGQAEARLARQILTAERASAARVERGADTPARYRHLAPAADQELRQAAAAKVVLRVAEQAAHGQPGALAATLTVDARAQRESRVSGRAERFAWPPPPAKPAVLASASGRSRIGGRGARSLEQGAAFDVAGLKDDPEAEWSLLTPVRLNRPVRPIMPAPESLLDPVLEGLDERPLITMPARVDQPVAAPDAGRVMFANAFRGYGPLLILEHDREYHTILWGFSELLVRSGDRVEAGQIVGVMGGNGVSNPELHVEFRRNGRPVGLLPWLAASSSKVRG